MTVYHIASILSNGKWGINLIEVGVLYPSWSNRNPSKHIKYALHLNSLEEAENCLKQKQLDNPNTEYKIINGTFDYDFSELDKLNVDV